MAPLCHSHGCCTVGGANSARACTRQPDGPPGNAPAAQLSSWRHAPQLQRGCAHVSLHRQSKTHRQTSRGQVSITAELPKGGWVPQRSPAQGLQPQETQPRQVRAPPQPQPQRRRPPLQRRVSSPPPQPVPPPPAPAPVHQKPQPLPQDGRPQPAPPEEHPRVPPPGIPFAPAPGRRQHQRWPNLGYLIVVEGHNDAKAVQAATDTEVFVLRGASHTADGATIESIRRAAFTTNWMRGIIALMDPDDAGRRGRNMLDAAFPQKCLHAFIPAADATAQLNTRYHEAGNLGVEHASPEAIQRALAYARSSQPGRTEFDRADLVHLGLVTEMDSADRGQNRFAPVMRELMGRLLGIGMCDGKQLAKQLNLYGFTRDEVVTATRLARQLLLDRIKRQQELKDRARQQQQGGPQNGSAG